VTSVLGSGFGLYGHLPALAELGVEVRIPARYRSVFQRRPELAAYRNAVRFEEEDASWLTQSEGVVLARRPEDNALLAREMIRRGSPSYVVIEKPLAPTQQDAVVLDRDLRAAGVSYFVPYLFGYCDWCGHCRQRLQAETISSLEIDWRYPFRMPAGSWKADHESGGGVLNYYFIHIVALLSFLFDEYEIVECRASRDESGDRIDLTACSGSVMARATFVSGPACRFSVSANGDCVMAAPTPFGAVPDRGERDPRIDPLKTFYREEVLLRSPTNQMRNRNERILKNWGLIGHRLRDGGHNVGGSVDFGRYTQL
jgi:predicted dehydrogenase